MIYIAADHFGIQAKAVVTTWLSKNGFKFEEFGSRAETDKCSIADFIPTVTSKVRDSENNRGIMICGTGIGVDIGANRFKGIRSVLASTPKVAEWSRTYDNSNVLCLSGWEFNKANLEAILSIWFSTKFHDPDGEKNRFLSSMDRWT